MFRTAIRRLQSACTLLCILSLASSSLVAQANTRVVSVPPSVVSLAPAERPVGESLARFARDARFEKAPGNYHVFAAASVRENASIETLTLNFAAETALTGLKMSNNDFKIEPGGSCYVGNHYTRGQSCSVLVRFTPQGPGHRLGFLQLQHSAETSVVSFGLIGNAYSPVISFTPSQISTMVGTSVSGVGTIKGSTSLATDGGDILYIADTGNNQVKAIDSTGTITPTAVSPIAVPASIAADSFGILYTANVKGATYYFSIYYPWGTQTAYGYAYTASACTPGSPCAFSAVGMNYPAAMSIDAYDDLFFLEGTTGAAEMPVSGVSGGSGTLNLWHLSDQFAYASGSPASFAADASGNLYTSYSFSTTTCYLLGESLYNAEYSPSATRVAGGAVCGFSGDGGKAAGAEISNKIGQIAFDTAGNLYFSDAGTQRVRRIDAVTGIISTIAGNGTAGYAGDGGAATLAKLSAPAGLAVDSLGQVYIMVNDPTAGPTQSIRKLSTKGYWNFGSQLNGTSSAPYVFTVANTGNDILTISSAPTFTGTNAADFSIDATTTSCMLTAGATLAAGRSCTIGIRFTPATTGARTANLVLHDNTVTGANTIVLAGTGSTTASTVLITSPTASVNGGSTLTFAASVSASSSFKPTGTVTFKVNNVAVGSPVTLSSTGTASTTFTETVAGTYTLTAAYSGDTHFSPSTATKSLSVTVLKAAVQVNLAPAGSTSACGAPSFAVRVTSPSGTPTGTVQLKSDSSVVGSAVLSDGIATLNSGRLSPGSHAFSASYAGDDLHEAGTSATVTRTLSLRGVCNADTPKAPHGKTQLSLQ